MFNPFGWSRQKIDWNFRFSRFSVFTQGENIFTYWPKWGINCRKTRFFTAKQKWRGMPCNFFSLGMGRQKCVFQVEFDDFERNLEGKSRKSRISFLHKVTYERSSYVLKWVFLSIWAVRTCLDSRFYSFESCRWALSLILRNVWGNGYISRSLTFKILDFDFSHPVGRHMCKICLYRYLKYSCTGTWKYAKYGFFFPNRKLLFSGEFEKSIQKNQLFSPL